jgi:hypothetical protein
MQQFLPLLRRFMVILALAPSLGCGSSSIFGGCGDDQSGVILSAMDETVSAGEVRSFDATSPRNSNFWVILTWSDPAAQLELEATDTSCAGIITACPYTSVGTGEGTRLELTHDGTKGRQIRVSVIGDENQEAVFRLVVSWLLSREC